MKCVFCRQILGGVALGSLAISILILNLRTLDFFFKVQKTNWTAVSKRYQRMIVTVSKNRNLRDSTVVAYNSSYVDNVLKVV